MDLTEVEYRLELLRARSTKGTTGTQASFLQLFDGDHDKVLRLEQAVARRMGFANTYVITGQTYSRKVDYQIVNALAGVGSSAHKLATDLRILASRKEMEEPFEAEQIGSSAMAYKRNPMRSERICSLARFLMTLPISAAETHANQWNGRSMTAPTAGSCCRRRFSRLTRYCCWWRTSPAGWSFIRPWSPSICALSCRS
jgi:adenylosuccinate lyase